MRRIYNIYVEEAGEAEAMYVEHDDDGFKLIGYWFMNDATWRGEYFDGFMEELGITVEYPKGALEKKLKALFKKQLKKDGVL